jgi:DNA-directed RNA polymerase subunit M/transcription elongation factor TFIIS
MASVLSCPSCRMTNVRPLPHVSSRSGRGESADFYRCESCGHVWWPSKSRVNGSRHEKPDAQTES